MESPPVPLDPATWLGTATVIVIALLIAAAIIVVAHVLFRQIGRRAPWVAELSGRTRLPWIALVLIVALWIGAGTSVLAAFAWWPGLSHGLRILTVLVGAWIVAALVAYGFERIIDREQEATDAEARRRRTQLVVLQRLSQVIIVILALGAVLFSFPEMRAVGTSLLASAGIVSIVAGLAAQSILGNLIAGIQLAFTDAIRVGDIVVVEGEWGRIGEINLSYVVFYIWDERRLVLPCSYFTSKPFETWTRQSDNVLGIVLMDLDWRVPMAAVREKFFEIIEASDAWDRRKASALVTGSEGGFVKVRFVMSSKDADDQWDLRCLVREELMTWLQQEHPEALPTSRFMMEKPA